MAIYLGSNRVANAHASGGSAPILISKNITSNGTYTAASDNADGYSSVDVNVSGGGSDELANSIIEKTITSINNSEVTKIEYFVFGLCDSLTTASFSNCTLIGNSAFYGCRSLTTVSFPNCISIGSGVFYNCNLLTTINFPNCTYISYSAFAYCSSLTAADFPKCTSIGSYAFAYCRSLTVVSFPSCTSIGISAFRSCYNLISLYLTGSSIPTLGSSAFYSTPLDAYSASAGQYGSIYVPSSLYNSYKTATNWSAYSSRFVSI